MTLPGTVADANAVSSVRRADHLDGLRGLAVTGVVVFHCATSLAAIPCGGYLGVPIFFMFAGYLLDFARLMAATPGWVRVLDRAKASYALVLKDSHNAAAVVERKHWSPVATDHGYVLLGAAP